MQLTKQTSGEGSWRVLTAQLDGTAGFPEFSMPANDAAWRAPPASAQPRVSWEDDAVSTACQADGLLRAIKRATYWLAAETLFGFAVCGSAAHSCLLDPDWSRYAHHPAERGSAGNPS